MEIKRNQSLLGVLTTDSIAIPDYQRDYAQGRKDNGRIDDIRSNFVKELYQALTHPEKELCHMGLVYGSFATTNRLEAFVAVDGQQRLTTCFLLHWYLLHRSETIDEGIKNKLNRFHWNSRIYSSEFADFLQGQERIALAPTASLKEYIQTSPSYFSLWEQDPSVLCMQEMLEAIHGNFGSLNTVEAEKCLALLDSEHCPVLFDILPLEDNTDETLYLKMNSRGLALTTYENFKSKFQDKILDNNSLCPSKLAAEVKGYMDGAWPNYIMHELTAISGESDFVDPDIYYMNLINEYALTSLYCKAGKNSQADIDAITSSKVKDNRTDVGFVPFEVYQHAFSSEQDLTDFKDFMNWIAINHKAVSATEDVISYNGTILDIMHSIVSNGVKETHRVLFYVLVRYAQLTAYAPLTIPEDLDNRLLHPFVYWLRIWHNLEHVTKTDRSNIKRAIEVIHSVDTPDVSKWLKGQDIRNLHFSQDQYREELAKAEASQNLEYAKGIFCQEKRKRFSGCVRLLGLYSPDTLVSYADFIDLRDWFEFLYDYKYTADKDCYDFWKCIITYADESSRRPTWISLCSSHDKDNLRNNALTKWFNRLLSDSLSYYRENREAPEAAWSKYCADRLTSWTDSYRLQNYAYQYQHSWIYRMLTEEEIEEFYYECDKKYLYRYDRTDTEWLYSGSRYNGYDMLISNWRDEIVRRFQPDAYCLCRDIFVKYKEVSVHFLCAECYVGIKQSDNVALSITTDNLTDGWFQNPYWAVVKQVDLNGTPFFENEGQTKEMYVNEIVQRIVSICNDCLERFDCNFAPADDCAKQQ